MYQKTEKEKELEILSHIQANRTPLPQRDLAELAGLSLGMTNAILKRLSAKGWLKIKRINSRKIQYAVTPAGTAEIARRSRNLLKTTLKSIGQYRDALDQYVRECREQGYTAIRLSRKTEIDFIVEWACARHGVALRYPVEGQERGGQERAGEARDEIVLDPEAQLAAASSR